jgi:hypothetical protein
MLPPIPDSNETPPFPEPNSAIVPPFPVPDLDKTPSFPEPDSAALPVPDSDTIPAFPEPDSATIPAFPELNSATIPAFPELDSATIPPLPVPVMPPFPEPRVPTLPVLPKSARREVRDFKQQRTIIGLAEFPTIEEMAYFRERGQPIPFAKHYTKTSKHSSPSNGDPPPKRQKKGKSTFIMSSTSSKVSISANKIASGSGPSRSHESQVPSPPAIKKDRGELFRRLGDKREVDPKYFKVRILCIVLLSLG